MVELLRFGMNNCYLISGTDGNILVDTGTESIRNKLFKQVKNRNIRLIVLTHRHIDHAANAGYLSEKLSVPVAMHRADNELLKDNSIRTIHATSTIGKIIKSVSEKEMRYAKIQPFSPIFIEDGDTFSEYGVDAKVLELRGHTQGSIGILTKDNEFIVGDAMMNMFMPTVSMLYEEKQYMLNSIEIIKQSGAKVIYVGHGRAINPIKYFK